MHIILFGTGCDLCREIAENIETVIAGSDGAFDFEKTSDLTRMLSYGIKSTPSLVIDEQVVAISEPLSIERITELLIRNNA